MGELVTLLASNTSWQLLRVISASMPNVRSKTSGGVQHNGTNSTAYAYALFLSSKKSHYRLSSFHSKLTLHRVRVRAQYAGLWLIFIGRANKSYTFNPDLLQLVPDVTKIPKLLPHEKANVIRKWNPKWTQIASQVPQLSMIFLPNFSTIETHNKCSLLYHRPRLLRADLKRLLLLCQQGCPICSRLLSTARHSTSCLLQPQLQLPHPAPLDRVDVQFNDFQHSCKGITPCS